MESSKQQSELLGTALCHSLRLAATKQVQLPQFLSNWAKVSSIKATQQRSLAVSVSEHV